MSNFDKYTNFDQMITPIIIKILFWVGVVVTIISGLILMFGDGGIFTFIGGLIVIAVGLLVTRVYCELLIIFFKMHESLQKMNEKLDRMTENKEGPM